MIIHPRSNQPTGIRGRLFLPVLVACLRILLGIIASQPGFRHLCRRSLRGGGSESVLALAGLGNPQPLGLI
jgi:hypothetical protein